MADEFKKFNARGAITYSDFTMAQARSGNERSKFPKQDDKIAPSVQLLLDAVQLDRIITHIRDVYLPAAQARSGGKEKRDAFDAGQVKKFLAALKDRGDEGWQSQSPYLPFAQVYEKTLEVAPWAVATLRFTGTAGKDIDQQARVNSEDELKVPDDKILTYPVLRPIDQTVHELYPGAWAYATLNLSGYVQSASNFGISAYANTVVFLEDRDRLAAGSVLDEEGVFLDD